ncbi:MAG: FHA domain-containing protein [Agarilytica sp.]
MTDSNQTIAAKFNTEILKKVNSPATHIELFHQGKELSFGKDDLPIRLGRDESACDLVVNSEVASRVHCSIEVKDNQIGLVDSSTNGTFLKLGRNESFVVKETFYPLIGQGNIKLGEQLDSEMKDSILFRMVTKTQDVE